MKIRTKTLLTTLIVLTITAIFVVGFVLAWDVFLRDKVDKLMNTDFYASDEPLYLSDVTVNLTSSGASALPERERLIVENYFTCYYASLGGFYHENLSRFYGFECTDEFADGLALDFEINSAKNAAADLSFKSCDIFIYIISRRTTREGTVLIELRADSRMCYGFSSTASEITGENHTFELSSGDDCLIVSHSTDRISRKFTDFVLEKVIAEKGYQKSDLAYTYFQPYINRADEIIAEMRTSHNEKISSLLLSEAEPHFDPEYPYDREKACLFAQSSEGNSENFGSYDENDVNFCSQCLYAAGIPMDAQGDRLTQWKWYDYEINPKREKSGCTRSWYERDRFYTYATENTGFGLAAESGLYIKKGDIIQLANGGETALQCIATDIIYGRDGRPADCLVCTDKIKNVPLSLLWNGEIKVINIVGYNTANI